MPSGKGGGGGDPPSVFVKQLVRRSGGGGGGRDGVATDLGGGWNCAILLPDLSSLTRFIANSKRF